MEVQAQEQQRHQWLEAIGIDSWLPREPLPGAAPSPEWVEAFCYAEDGTSWQDESRVDDSVDQAQPTARPSRPAGSRIDTAALLDEPRRPAAPEPSPARPEPAQAAPVAPDAVPAAKPDPAPRFKLAYLVRGDLLIVDSLPPHQPDGFSRHHRRLLLGMTSALGMAAEEELSSPFMLPWPMLAGKNLNQGPLEARRAVQRKLHNTLAFNPGIRQVLLLGEAACHWVAEQEGGFDSLQGQLLELGEGRRALVTLSLSELLRLPERKAEVWRDLQPFRRNSGHA